jgi:hypothetical protein
MCKCINYLGIIGIRYWVLSYIGVMGILYVLMSYLVISLIVIYG